MSKSSFWQKLLEAIQNFFKPKPPQEDILAEEKKHGFTADKIRATYGDWRFPSQAKPTLKMKKCEVGLSSIHLEFDAPDKWKGNNNPPGTKGCSGGVHLYIRQPDGTWSKGGRFDDIGGWSGVDDRPCQHIWDEEEAGKDYPTMWRCPEVGAEVAVLIESFDGSVSQHGSERTTAGFSTWKRKKK